MTNIKTDKQIINEEAGLMIRVDKTLRELMEEKPSNRWDVNYWHIKYDVIIIQLKTSKYPLKQLGEFIIQLTTNNHTRKKFVKQGTTYYQTEAIRNTGLLHNLAKKVVENSENDPMRTRLKIGDIMIIRSGTGSVGRVFTVCKDLGKANTIESVYLTRVKKINSAYIAIFLLTKYGQAELLRTSNGVSGIININAEELKHLLIPVLNTDIQKKINYEYTKMNTYHDKAIEAKIKNDEKGNKENLEIAEKMLLDLIHKTEQVIRGERNDVI